MTDGGRVADDPNAGSRPTGDRAPDAVSPEDLRGGNDWTAEDVIADVGWRPPGSLDPGAGTAVPDPATWLPALADRSPSPWVCPFLRAVGPGDVIGHPLEAPDVANRCAALREPVPQSLRQQELVCLSTGHINCPRYLRGALLASEVPARRVRVRSAVTPAIAASLVVLALSFAVSFGFVVANGGLTLPVAAIVTSAPSGTAAAIGPTADPDVTASSSPSLSASPVPASPAPASATPTSSPTPIATPVPTPRPTATPRPKPTSDRFALLTRCPNKPDCWIYIIRSGDNLYSIANYFGVSLERVKALNPWTRTERLRAGRQLILPTPTR
jgi:LysM domain